MKSQANVASRLRTSLRLTPRATSSPNSRVLRAVASSSPVVLAALVLLATPCAAQSTARVSVSSSGGQANSGSSFLAGCLSADGLHHAFTSSSTNLVSGDTNFLDDTFARDLVSGITTRVSVSSSGAQGTGGSFGSYGPPSISADGRYVVFSSTATNLVTGDVNGKMDIFLHDMQSGTTSLVSVDSAGVQGDNDSGTGIPSSISADGRYIAFCSNATNLVAGDTNATMDIFVHDVQTGVTSVVSVDSAGVLGNGSSQWPSNSADGRYVAFGSGATNLVPGDTNGVSDVFVHDMQTGLTTRVNVDSAGAEANGSSFFGSCISGDGRFVAFGTFATNMVPGDTNGFSDVFVRDLHNGATVAVSVDPAGMLGNGASSGTNIHCISGDGRFVAFSSSATNLVTGDTNGVGDIFVRDMLTGVTSRASVDSAGVQANFSSTRPSISADGRFIAFNSTANNLVSGDTNGSTDDFIRDQGVPPVVSFCFGDGSAAACPCANSGAIGHGCENSAGTGGAVLSATGVASLAGDTLVLTAAGEPASVISALVQGDAVLGGSTFGDGLRCVGGGLRFLYIRNAVGGSMTAPQAGEPSISARAAALGDVLPMGVTRSYQMYYRDPDLGFCASPQGNSWNISSGLSVVWSQ